MTTNLIKERLQDILIILAFVIIYFFPVILSPAKMIDPSQDIAGIFLPDKQILVSEVLTHKVIPLWNPYNLGGEPFVAKPSTAVFYPLNFIYFVLPLPVAFGLMFILDYFLLGIFTYFFAKKIGIKRIGAIISAITVIFSAPLISLIFLGHIINLDAFIWFPLILYGIELIIQKLDIRTAAITSIPTALALLAGAPQVAVYMLLGVVIYIAVRLMGEKNNIVGRVFLLFLFSAFFSFCLAAVQLLPTFELSRLSIRANGLPFAFATDFLLHPMQLIGAIFPHVFGGVKDSTFWGKGSFASSATYIGIIPLFLAIYVVFINFKNNKYVKAFTILAIFSVVYAMGKYTPLFSFFYYFVPTFDGFRVPARFLYFYVFSLSILAGFGFDALIKKLNKAKDFVKLRAAGLIGVVIILLLSIFTFVLSKQKDIVLLYEQIILRNSFAVGIDHVKLLNYLYADIYKALALLLLLFFLVFILSIKKINKNFVIIIFVLIIFFDLWSFGRPLIINSNGILYSEDKIITRVKSDHSNFRVFDMSGLLLPSLTVNKIENITGVHSLQLAEFRNLLWQIGSHDPNFFESFVSFSSIYNPRILDVLSVKYIISEQKLSIPIFSEVMSENKLNKKLYLYKNNNFFPEAYVSPGNGSIKITKVDANTTQIVVNLHTPGLLMLADSWYPGWRVYDNDREGSILKINSIQKGIYLSSGKHTIKFVYDSIVYKSGLILSLFSLLLLIFIVVRFQTISKSGRGKIK